MPAPEWFAAGVPGDSHPHDLQRLVREEEVAALHALRDRFRSKYLEGASVEALQAAVEEIPENERPADPDREPVSIPPPTHAPDFSTINWGGVLFPFGPRQRRAVGSLWASAENRTHLVGSAFLLGVAGARGRVRDLFRGSTALGTLILGHEQHRQLPGAWRLTDRPVIGLVRGRGVYG